jgi:signal transduction histidine kinase
LAAQISDADAEKKRKSDSLEYVLETQELTPLEKFVILDSLNEYNYNYNLQGFVTRAEEMLEIMGQENIDDKEKALDLMSNIGMTCVMTGEYDKAIDYLNRSIPLAQELNDRYVETRIITNIGNAYSLQGQYINALDYYLQTLRLSENYKNTDNPIGINYSRALGNIAETYYMMGNFSQAFLYAEKFFEINPREICVGNHIVAQVYYILASVYLHRDELEKAEENALNSLGCKTIIYECFSTEALAKIYLRRGDYDKAMEYADESLRYADELGDPSMYAKAYNVLSDIYISQKQYDKAELTALKAMEMNPLTLSIEPNLAYNIALSNIYLGNKEKAESFLHKYNEIVSRNNNKHFQEILASMEVQYEINKKEGHIVVLEKDKKMRFWLNILIGFSAMILFVACYTSLYNALQNRRNVKHDTKIAEQNFKLEEQKWELAENERMFAEQKMKQAEKERELEVIKASIRAEADERESIARHLHDVLGSMLIMVRFNLNLIKSFYLLPQSDIDNLSTAVTVLNQSITEVRHLAHYMMPPELRQYGLKVALENYCKSVAIARYKYLGDNSRPDIELEILLYRFAFELIGNAIKYSSATLINVQLTMNENLITLTVYDNGIGFDPDAVTFGMGFKNIQYRIENYSQNKSTVNINSTIGKETEVGVEIEIPVPDKLPVLPVYVPVTVIISDKNKDKNKDDDDDEEYEYEETDFTYIEQPKKKKKEDEQGKEKEGEKVDEKVDGEKIDDEIDGEKIDDEIDDEKIDNEIDGKKIDDEIDDEGDDE